jgi:hypothetical protein
LSAIVTQFKGLLTALVDTENKFMNEMKATRYLFY